MKRDTLSCRRKMWCSEYRGGKVMIGFPNLSIDRRGAWGGAAKNLRKFPVGNQRSGFLIYDYPENQRQTAQREFRLPSANFASGEVVNYEILAAGKKAIFP